MKDLVEATARKAGELLMSYYKKPQLKVMIKKDGTQVTEADLAASDFIKSALAPLGYPIVSEEDIPDHVDGDEFFVIDPLDGTKYFANQESSFATLIGFVSKKRPVLGVAYFPELDLFYSAEKGKGATLNGKPMFNAPSAKPRVAYSSGFHLKPQAKVMMERLKISEIREGGSVLKLCRVAQGEGDFYPRFGETSEWDTAACQIIIEEAGCVIWDVKTMQPLIYGKPNYLNTGFVVFRKDMQPEIEDIFKDLKWPKRVES